MHQKGDFSWLSVILIDHFYKMVDINTKLLQFQTIDNLLGKINTTLRLTPVIVYFTLDTPSSDGFVFCQY